MLPRILVIDQDSHSVEQVRRILETQGCEVSVATTGQQGLDQARLERPDLILLDVELPDVSGYEVCRSLRANPSTAKLPILIYSAKADVEDKVAGFRAGANDYIAKPFAPAELVVRVQAALGSLEQSLAHIIALWGSKGGVGTTTVASNLAMAVKSMTGKRVTMLDASVLGGTLGVVLNLRPTRTIADLLPYVQSLDADLLASVLATHSSGVRVLLSTPWSTNGDTVHPGQLERIVRALQTACDYVIIDTAPSLDERTIAVLELADQVVVVLTPEMTSMRNARVFLQMTRSRGQRPEEFVVVLNRHLAKGGIGLHEVEKGLRRKTDVQIPCDEPLVTYSINRGVPLVTSHPRSPVAKGFYRLAQVLVARAEETERVTQGSTDSA